jgi:hypothetical protein
MTDSGQSQPASAPRRLPYERPLLRVFGSVAALTAALAMDAGAMDGGPNNLKT